MKRPGWNAKGMVRPVWSRLPGPGAREKLAELVGTPAETLSALNSGQRVMTLDMAERITRAVPGLTIYDLGAPDNILEPAEQPPTVLERLKDLDERVTRLEVDAANADKLLAALRRLQAAGGQWADLLRGLPPPEEPPRSANEAT